MDRKPIEPSPTVERDEPAPRHVFDDPEIRKSIEEARRRAAARAGRPGSTADDLLKLAREQARVDP